MATENGIAERRTDDLLRDTETACLALENAALEAEQAAGLTALRDLGVAVIKSLVLINAGAVLAVLTFTGQLWAKSTPAVEVILAFRNALGWFSAGLVLAMSAALAAVISAFTAVETTNRNGIANVNALRRSAQIVLRTQERLSPEAAEKRMKEARDKFSGPTEGNQRRVRSMFASGVLLTGSLAAFIVGCFIALSGFPTN